MLNRGIITKMDTKGSVDTNRIDTDGLQESYKAKNLDAALLGEDNK